LWNVLTPWRVETQKSKVKLLLPGPGSFSEFVEREEISKAFFSMGKRLEKVGDSPVRGRFGFRKLINLGFSAPGLIQAIWQIKRLANKHNPEVVLANGFKAQIFSALAIKKNIPLIWYFQDYVSNRKIVSKILPQVDRSNLFLIADSKSVAEDLGTIIRGKKITIWKNTVDTGNFRPIPLVETKTGGASDKRLKVGLVATFAKWKGHETFLKAAKHIIDMVGDVVQFLVIGGPVYQSGESQWSMEELEKMAQSIGVKGSINFIGFQNNIIGIYNDLDVVVHASTSPEPFGQVIIEAMACGKPVVVAGHGGAEEIGSHGVDLMYHVPGDSISLANAILSLLREEKHRRKIGLAARQTAVNSYDVSRVFQYWESLQLEMKVAC
jgi:glycosyltransferase involved in cell wall biosynthesis